MKNVSFFLSTFGNCFFLRYAFVLVLMTSSRLIMTSSLFCVMKDKEGKNQAEQRGANFSSSDAVITTKYDVIMTHHDPFDCASLIVTCDRWNFFEFSRKGIPNRICFSIFGIDRSNQSIVRQIV